MLLQFTSFKDCKFKLLRAEYWTRYVMSKMHSILLPNNSKNLSKLLKFPPCLVYFLVWFVQWWLQKLSGFIVNSTCPHLPSILTKSSFSKSNCAIWCITDSERLKSRKGNTIVPLSNQILPFFTLLPLITIWIYRRNFVGLMYF